MKTHVKHIWYVVVNPLTTRTNKRQRGVQARKDMVEKYHIDVVSNLVTKQLQSAVDQFVTAKRREIQDKNSSKKT